MLNAPSRHGLEPPELAKDPDAIEVLRVWTTQRWSAIQFALETGHIDPAAWGILLADVARHAAKAYALNTVCSENDALRRIYQAFEAERSAPTDVPEGFLRG